MMRITKLWTWQPVSSLDTLKQGDRVRWKKHGPGGHESIYNVHANYGKSVIAAEIVDITNPPEWEVLRSVEVDT